MANPCFLEENRSQKRTSRHKPVKRRARRGRPSRPGRRVRQIGSTISLRMKGSLVLRVGVGVGAEAAQ